MIKFFVKIALVVVLALAVTTAAIGFWTLNPYLLLLAASNVKGAEALYAHL